MQPQTSTSMSKYRQGGLTLHYTHTAQGLEHELDGLNLCVRRTARELRVRARQEGVRATRHPHTHTQTHTAARQS